MRNLSMHRKIDALALAAIAQGRIVDFDFGFHKYAFFAKKCILRRFFGLASNA
jgi:hypothetical protein